MIIVYISFVILVVTLIISTFVIIAKDSFENYAIRINEAEANIEATLNKRFDLLNKSNNVIKEAIQKEEDALQTILKIRSQKLDNFELDKKLYYAIEEFHEYSELNIELQENDEYTKIEIDLLKSESEIVALKEYYNDVVEKYNFLLNKAPYSLISKIKKFEEKEKFILEDHTKLINSLK